MPLGTGLSSGAAAALTRLAARPSKAERLQGMSNDAAAGRQASSQAYNAQQRELAYQRATDDRNVERNDRANEIFNRERQAEYMMERQNEMAVEAKRKEHAFKLQNAMKKRTKTAAAGGTGVTPVQRGSATLTSNRTGDSVEFDTAAGLQQTVSGITSQLRGPAPVPVQTMEPGSVEEKRRNDSFLAFSKEQSKIDERLTYLSKSQDSLQYEGDGITLVPPEVLVNRLRQYAKEAQALHKRAAAIRRMETLMGFNGPEAAAKATRKVRSMDGVADPHMDEAIDDAFNNNIDPKSPEFKQHVNNFLKSKYNYGIE